MEEKHHCSNGNPQRNQYLYVPCTPASPVVLGDDSGDSGEYRVAGGGRELADAFSVSHAGLDEAGFLQARDFAELIVQTTSAGMSPNIAADPAPGLFFSGKEVVYELLYAPPTTAFLRRALVAGCRVVRGRKMLVGQAMEQFRLFTGSAYPAGLRADLEAETD